MTQAPNVCRDGPYLIIGELSPYGINVVTVTVEISQPQHPRLG
jgi:hypothetical protein